VAIQTVRQREKLKARREPYWALIGTGQHIGFRVTESGGHWVARRYDSETRKRVYRSLGDLAGIPDADRYSRAAKLAGEWFKHLDGGGEAEVITVADAFRLYIDHQGKRKGKLAKQDAQSRFRRHIEHDPIARIALLKLSPTQVEAWRERLAERPSIAARRGPNCKLSTPPTPPRPRSPATLKRDLVALRAALNLAKSKGYVASDLAWTRALEPPSSSAGQSRREVYLTATQRRAIVEAIEEADLRALVTALCSLPIRPGALAALRVADYAGRDRVLIVRSDKANAGRKVPVTAAVAELLRAQVRGKLPAAYIFSRANGAPWDKNAWREPFQAACEKAGIHGVTMYAIRHSVITDLIVGDGKDRPGLDIFYVSQLAGTSVTMVEKVYGHLQHDRARAALAGLAL
jgi:integrase